MIKKGGFNIRRTGEKGGKVIWKGGYNGRRKREKGGKIIRKEDTMEGIQ